MTVPVAVRAIASLSQWEIEAAQARRGLARFAPMFVPEAVPAAHHLLLIDKLERVTAGEITRMMVFMPPGSAKSTYGSVLWPAWHLGHRPGHCVIGASHTAELAERFGRRVRGIVADERYSGSAGRPGVFGESASLSGESRAAGRWDTRSRSEYFAAGVGGAITGRRADVAVIDDPVKSREEADSEVVRARVYDWYLADLRTRLKPGAAIVLIITRWHEDDLAGRILPEKYDGESGVIRARDGEDWTVLALQAIADRDDDPLGRKRGEPIWPAWQSADVLEQERISQGPRNWEALYQQRPHPREGTLFRTERMLTVDAAPDGLECVRGWDLAATEQIGSADPDYTAGVKLGVTPDGMVYILDVRRQQTSPHGVESMICDAAASDGRRVRISLPQDPGQAGKSQIAYLTRKLQGHIVASSPETGSKERRAEPIAAQIEAGNVRMLKAGWNAEFIDELKAFPSGRHDDMVDALSRAYMLLTERAVRPAASPLRQPVRSAGGWAAHT